MPNKPENTEWAMIHWWDADHAGRPHALIVGDSITVGYGEKVHRLVRERFFVGRLATSKCVDNPSFRTELDYMLREFPCAVIHFNNGLHGWACTEEEYEAAYARTVQHILETAPGARVILASSTAFRDAADLSQFHPKNNPRVLARNAIVKDCAQRHGLAMNDLYETTAARPELYSADAVHLTPEGYDVLARQVADAIAG